MKVAITVNHGRVAPVFPGVGLKLLDESESISSIPEDIITTSWPLLRWAAELMRHDVSVLLCGGIDNFVWGSLQGYGIEVIPNAVGLPDEVIKQWRSGNLIVPQMWPPQHRGGSQRGGPRRRQGNRGCEPKNRKRRSA